MYLLQCSNFEIDTYEKSYNVLHGVFLVIFMRPKFFAFIQCIFDDNWKILPINELPAERQYITENMARLRSEHSGATANILDMSYKEIRITFKETAVVGLEMACFTAMQLKLSILLSTIVP